MTPRALYPVKHLPSVHTSHTRQHPIHPGSSPEHSHQPCSTHTSTHHPKHPPIPPTLAFSPHPTTCLLPNLPTHSAPTVKSPALNSQTFSSNIACLTTNFSHTHLPSLHLPLKPSTHPLSTLHPPKASPVSHHPPTPSGFLGSTACSQCAQGAMGGLGE